MGPEAHVATPTQAVPHVVILGAGFGGLTAARALKHDPVQVTVIDRTNYHLFQPLLYQVATAGLNPSNIASPVRKVLRGQKNARVLLGDARAIDVANRKVLLDSGEVPYDFLIVATGATHSYFGRDDWARFAPGLKTIEDALEIRRRVLLAFEMAERETDPERRQAWLTFVVVGAGPTGVELAGSLAEISRHTLARDFRNIDPRQARILLLEGADRVLPVYDPELSAKATRQLEELGVQVWTSKKVTAIDDHGVQVGRERLEARTVLWAAGVAASPLAKSLDAPLDRAGRVQVTQELTLPGRQDVFVIGDLASVKSDGQPVPGVAPAAMQMGRHTVANVRRALRKEPLAPFHYKDKGSLATIGRAAAVADFGKVKLSGFLAWLAWLLIHVFFIIGFRNRVLVMFEWAWSYLTFERGARLITGSPGQEPEKVDVQAPKVLPGETVPEPARPAEYEAPAPGP